jgi:hypothetical protein
MNNEKQIRCVLCREEFSENDVTPETTCCPNCKTKSLPMAMEEDVTIKVNIHELSILCSWAEFYAQSLVEEADSPHAREMVKLVDILAQQLESQLGDKWRPLTLSRELKDIKEELKGAKITIYRNGKEEEI